MAGSNRKNEPDHTDFVPVIVAGSVGEAEMFRQLLEDHDIPSILGSDEDIQEEPSVQMDLPVSGITHGVPVLVPEELLDEAGEIIADRDDFEEFEDEDELEDEEDDELDINEGMSETLDPLLGDDDDEDFMDDDDEEDDKGFSDIDVDLDHDDDELD